MAEWLRSGLQIRVLRFESGRGLHLIFESSADPQPTVQVGFFVLRHETPIGRPARHSPDGSNHAIVERPSRPIYESPMIAGFAVLLLCQLVGEIVVRSLGLPLPGPVLGLGLLFVALALRSRLTGRDESPSDPSPVGRAADGLLSILSLLFVPAGVGIVQHLGRLEENGFALAVTLLVSTAVTLAVTALVFVGVKRLLKLDEPRP